MSKPRPLVSPLLSSADLSPGEGEATWRDDEVEARSGTSLIRDREEHFYQLGLRQFGAFHRLRLDPPPLLRDLVSIAADDEEGILSNGLDPGKVVDVSTPSAPHSLIAPHSRPGKGRSKNTTMELITCIDDHGVTARQEGNARRILFPLALYLWSARITAPTPERLYT